MYDLALGADMYFHELLFKGPSYRKNMLLAYMYLIVRDLFQMPEVDDVGFVDLAKIIAQFC